MLKLNVGRVTIPASSVITQIVPSRADRKELRLIGVGGTGSTAIGITSDSGDAYTDTFVPTGETTLDDMEDAVYGIYSAVSPSSKVVQFLEIYDDGM